VYCVGFGGLGLLPGQPALSRLPEVDRKWSPEAVRRAMPEVRYWNEANWPNFNRRLKAAQKELAPKS
jgi:hypothetical protein